MDRREFLKGLGHAAAVVAAAAQGREGEAAEPPGIARGDEPVSWFACGTTEAETRVSHYADGSSQCVSVFRANGHADGAWPAGVVPTVSCVGTTLILTAAWTTANGPWTGRQLRRRGDRIEQYVFGEGTWEPVGEA